MARRGRSKYSNEFTDMERHKESYVKTCPICKTEFDIYGFTNWAYRTKNIYFCSYTCMREFDKKHSKSIGDYYYE